MRTRRASHSLSSQRLITAVSARNELPDAQESPIARAELARKLDRDTVIAHPDEITETQIAVTEIPEFLHE